jgi:hypothetical protein
MRQEAIRVAKKPNKVKRFGLVCFPKMFLRRQ